MRKFEVNDKVLFEALGMERRGVVKRIYNDMIPPTAMVEDEDGAVWKVHVPDLTLAPVENRVEEKNESAPVTEPAPDVTATISTSEFNAIVLDAVEKACGKDLLKMAEFIAFSALIATEIFAGGDRA